MQFQVEEICHLQHKIQQTEIKSYSEFECTTYPGRLAPGPIEVENMRLNSIGEDKELPERGAFTSYALNNSSSSDLE